MEHTAKNELITEGQELIALFMGFTQKSYTPTSDKLWCDHKHGLPVGNLKFYESWDWLIPCIKKISDELSYDWYMDNIVTHLLDNNIERAFEISVDAIKTHNESGGGN